MALLRHSQFSGSERDSKTPDWWELPRFQAIFWAQADSIKAAGARPTYQRVTQTFGRLLENEA